MRLSKSALLAAAVTVSACTNTPEPAASPPVAGTKIAGKEIDWKAVDWPITTFGPLGCQRDSKIRDKAEIHQVRYTDITGDGTKEAIVAAGCPSASNTNPVHIFVYEGGPKDPILTIGKDQYLQSADVTIEGSTLTVVSEALSEDAPRCCADLLITQTYAWTAGTFGRPTIKQEKLKEEEE